jgi:RNA polymerase sigma-70 factor (ECF subfamily)
MKRLFDSDVTLVRQLQKNDKQAFELIFNKYRRKLYFFTLGYLHSQAETEEIIQNVFLSLWENRDMLNESYSLQNFLYKVTVNHIFNHLKHELVRKKYADRFSDQFIEDNNSEESILMNDLQQVIDSLVEELPMQQQVIFKLSRHDGLSHSEIANNLGLSIRSVENQIYRALKFIRGKLRQESLINE